MAIYHFSAKMISRARGSSALAAAAYRSASRLHDQRLDRHHDFSYKPGVIHSEVMLPTGAPEHLGDRATLWNAAEAAERRKDAQLAREIEFAIPRELSTKDGTALARAFVKAEFTTRGMIADLNVHRDIGADGQPKSHVHVMLTTREVGASGFGAKNRDWNRTDLLECWRERWASHVNTRLAELDIDARIDHRSLEAQGINLTPQHKIGPAASRMAAQGLTLERVDEHRDIARANGAKMLADPRIALDAITRTQATFTIRDLAMFVHRHSDGKDQFDQVMAAVRTSPELVALGQDGRGNERFSSREMIATEQRLERATIGLADRAGHGVPTATLEKAIGAAGSNGLVLGAEQQAALKHLVRAQDLSIVTGYAGTGKSAMLSVAHAAWERAGYTVRGTALSGIAAENLQHGSGIVSCTIASMEHRWAQGEDLLSSRDVLVIDEAGMIGTRQMERVIIEAEKRRAKVVLVGDPEQLQAIEAGAAFRAAAERHGSVEITQIRRQREDWQRDATRQLATGRTSEAIAAYEQKGHLHVAASRVAARANLIERWDRDRTASPNLSRIILTHTNEEVHELNQAARQRLRSAGALGEEVAVPTEHGGRQFARGDRIIFLKNERSLGVKNGSIGTVQGVTMIRMAVLLDDGRAVAFDLKDYASLDYGYAATVHKLQGATVDRVHLLATPGLDCHSTYVALSRHRDRVDLHYGHDDFADQGRLVRMLSRDRAKDMASDYARDPSVLVTKAFAARRQIQFPDRSVAKSSPEWARDPFAKLDLRPVAPQFPRGIFDGLDLAASSTKAAGSQVLDGAVRRFAQATGDIMRVQREGYTELPHQRLALERASEALDVIRTKAAHDLQTAFSRDAGLIREAAEGRTSTAIRAMMLEAELQGSPELRADRFVEDLQKLAKSHRSFRDTGDEAGVRVVAQQLAALGRSLERDAQAESFVRKRLPLLGIPAREGSSISHSIQEWSGLSRNRGLGR